MLACSRPRNSRVLESHHIAACSDDSALAMVDGVGTLLAGAVRDGWRQFVFPEGFVERLAGGYPLCQSGMRDQAHAVQRLPHCTRFAPRVSRHAHVGLVSQLPNNAIRG